MNMNKTYYKANERGNLAPNTYIVNKEYYEGKTITNYDLASMGMRFYECEHVVYANFDDEKKLHGRYTEYYNDGKVKYKGHFFHGKRVGTHQGFFPYGLLHCESIFDKDGKEITGIGSITIQCPGFENNSDNMEMRQTLIINVPDPETGKDMVGEKAADYLRTNYPHETKWLDNPYLDC